MSKNDILYGALSCVFLILCFTLVNPAEDAVILYEYSKTLAETGVISYGNNGIPIEGATDFLWMFIISIFSYVGVSEFLASLLLTSVALVYIFKQLEKLKYGLILSFICIFLTPYVYSSAQGFSAIFFSAFYIQCLLYFKNSEYKKMYIWILLLCLVRPDGVVWAMPLVLLHQINGGIRLDKIKVSLKYLIVPGIAYFSLRYLYFGELLPLPFYVKAAGDRDFLTFFWSSVKNVFYCALPFTIYFAIKKDWKSLFIILIPILFFSSMQLSQNIGNRFLAPMFFGGLTLLQPRTMDKIFVVMACVILSFKITVSTGLNSLETKHENVFSLSKSLYGIDGKMLITEAGRLAYYSDWVAQDAWGLNTPNFAKKLITPKDVSDGNYDLVVSNCNDMHFILDNKNKTEMTKRTWHNQCINIGIGVKKDYDYYLVPFKNGDSFVYSTLRALYHRLKGTSDTKNNCLRYDLYSVRKSSKNKNAIVNVILNHGGIPYSNDLHIVNNTICKSFD